MGPMTPGGIVEEAARQLGVEPDAGLAWEGLCQLHESFHGDWSPSPLAIQVFESSCVRQLGNFLVLDRLASELEPRPTFDEVVVIVGLPRTGSTLLHNLLATDPTTASLNHVDLRNSWWMLGRETREAAAKDVADRLMLIDAVELRIRDIHPTDPAWPDECTVIFGNSFASYQWVGTFGVPSYFDWLGTVDMRPHYDSYRRSVDVVVRKTRPDARRLVLKSPFHVLYLEELRRVFPDAVVINVVRSTAEVVGSWLQFMTVTHGPLSDGRSLPGPVVERWLRSLGQMAAGSVAAADDGCHTLAYSELARDPIATLERILGLLGRELTPAHRAAADAWLAQPEARRRGPAHSLAAFGLGAADLPAELRHYDEVFGLTR